MRIAVFSTRPYDRAHFDRANARHGHELVYFEPHLDAATSQLAAGCEAVCAFVDEPRRFGAKRIGSYFGLVPRQDQSGTTNRLGHITREGPPVVRRLLTEAAWRSSRCSARVKAVFERIHRGERERRKLALVATSHYLARVMLAMLQSGEAWREEVVA